jgi:antitoxin YefM
MAIAAAQARHQLDSLIDQVNNDYIAVEIVSGAGNAYLVSAAQYAALRETASPLRERRDLDPGQSGR